jgi:geranylgeranyl diphosphate synthase type II
VEDYLKMIHKKTSYLLLASLKMGALLGDASDELIDELHSFANNLGLGFQIQDDMLDLLSDNPKFGKIKGQDLIEGKKTYLIIEAAKRAATDEDKALMKNYYDSDGMGSKDIPKMIELMERLQVFDDAKKLASDYFGKAKSSLDKLPDNEYRDMLGFILEDIQVRTV